MKVAAGRIVSIHSRQEALPRRWRPQCDIPYLGTLGNQRKSCSASHVLLLSFSRLITQLTFLIPFIPIRLITRLLTAFPAPPVHGSSFFTRSFPMPLISSHVSPQPSCPCPQESPTPATPSQQSLDFPNLRKTRNEIFKHSSIDFHGTHCTFPLHYPLTLPLTPPPRPPPPSSSSSTLASSLVFLL
ncbi:hypothetical protein E2C01_072008 [Portunus trituberculatus]|uniref:Uncharacterized protein n=1 Tax=Portunus trituberculatus TaxID=210409 RepID=A0A5B7HWV4_PORTR|nr:hypothetical protein [Portunus trituberculatus]